MQVKIKNILGSNFGKLPVFLAEHLFFSFFLVIFSVIILTNLLFYKYYILNQQISLESTQEQLISKQKNHNNLLNFWEEQNQKFQNADSRNYLDIFKTR